MLQHFQPNKSMTASSYESVQKGLEESKGASHPTSPPQPQAPTLGSSSHSGFITGLVHINQNRKLGQVMFFTVFWLRYLLYFFCDYVHFC